MRLLGQEEKQISGVNAIFCLVGFKGNIPPNRIEKIDVAVLSAVAQRLMDSTAAQGYLIG